MAVSQVHIIQRLETELNVPFGRKEGERLSRRVLEVMKDDLLPALEREFDRLIMPNEYLRLDKLTVDLDLDSGAFHLKGLMEQLKNKIVTQVANEIDSGGDFQHLDHTGDASNDLPDKPDSERDEKGKRFVLTNEAHVLETLVYILKEGYYPWWYRGQNRIVFEDTLDKISGSQKKIFGVLFQRVDFSIPVYRRRFMALFSLKHQEQILQDFFGRDVFIKVKGELEELKKILTKLFKNFGQYETTAVIDFFLSYQSSGQLPKEELKIWEEALLFWRKLIGNDVLQQSAWRRQLAKWEKAYKIKPQKAALIEQILKSKNNKKQTQQTEQAISSNKISISPLSDRLQRRIESYLSQISLNRAETTDLRAWMDGAKSLPSLIQQKLLNTIPAQDHSLRLAILNSGAGEKDLRADLRSKTRGEFPEEGIYIGNAGLVLLHPFVLHFFRATGLCKEESFLNVEAQEKAVHLLQYLAAKRLLDPDPELVFNKILCGIPPDQPVARHHLIREEEQAEADHLLEVILGYWKALGSTSIDGLRFNFLLRGGKLSQTSDGWKLLVERKSQDILLDSLPWGFSLIKLPWMDKKMFVEW